MLPAKQCSSGSSLLSLLPISLQPEGFFNLSGVEEGQRAAEREGSRSPGKRWRSRGSRLALGPPPAHSSLPTDIGGGGLWRQEQKRNAWSAAACSMEKHLRAEDAAWPSPFQSAFSSFCSSERVQRPRPSSAELPPSSGRVQILQLLCRPRLPLQGLSCHSHPQSKGPIESFQRRQNWQKGKPGLGEPGLEPGTPDAPPNRCLQQLLDIF